MKWGKLRHKERGCLRSAGGQLFRMLQQDYLRITVHKKIAVKTVTKGEAASHDDEVAPSDVAIIVDIATFMKQPFRDRLSRREVNCHITCSILCMSSSTRNAPLRNILHFLHIDA